MFGLVLLSPSSGLPGRSGLLRRLLRFWPNDKWQARLLVQRMGRGPVAILSRAEHALEQGETGFALLQLEDLPLPAQEAMADWIAQARARAEANAAVAALTSRFAGETE